MKKILALASVMLLAASLSYAQSNTGTTTMQVTVGAEAAIVVGSTGNFGSSGIFGNYLTTTPLTYYVRTISGGTITVEITTDFSAGGPGGGPSVKTPPTSTDTLTYTSSAGAPVTGTANGTTSAVTASTATATTVETFGATTQSHKVGDPVTVSWDLVNDPAYAAGTYTATATFTISAS